MEIRYYTYCTVPFSCVVVHLITSKHLIGFGLLLFIQNTYGTSGRAVAVSVSGDKAAFYGCSILSYQDTLLDDAGRHYYSNCYIQGATDFICGNAASLFEVSPIQILMTHSCTLIT